jgi:hypothetical protein
MSLSDRAGTNLPGQASSGRQWELARAGPCDGLADNDTREGNTSRHLFFQPWKSNHLTGRARKAAAVNRQRVLIPEDRPAEVEHLFGSRRAEGAVVSSAGGAEWSAESFHPVDSS